MKKKNNRYVMILLSAIFLTSTTGCKNNSDNNQISKKEINVDDNNYVEDNSYDNVTDMVISEDVYLDSEVIIESTEQETKENKLIEEAPIEKETNSKEVNEEVVENYITSELSDVDNLVSNNNVEKAKEKIIGLYNKIYDFIYNGTEIHGITYELLSETAKNQYKNDLEDLKKLKEKICSIEIDESVGDITLRDIYNSAKEQYESDKEDITNAYNWVKNKIKK